MNTEYKMLSRLVQDITIDLQTALAIPGGGYVRSDETPIVTVPKILVGCLWRYLDEMFPGVDEKQKRKYLDELVDGVREKEDDVPDDASSPEDDDLGDVGLPTEDIDDEEEGGD